MLLRQFILNHFSLSEYHYGYNLRDTESKLAIPLLARSFSKTVSAMAVLFYGMAYPSSCTNSQQFAHRLSPFLSRDRAGGGAWGPGHKIACFYASEGFPSNFDNPNPRAIVNTARRKKKHCVAISLVLTNT